MIRDGEAASPENFSYFFSQRKSLLRFLALFFFPSLAGWERLWRFVWNALELYFLSLLVGCGSLSNPVAPFLHRFLKDAVMRLHISPCQLPGLKMPNLPAVSY